MDPKEVNDPATALPPWFNRLVDSEANDVPDCHERFLQRMMISALEMRLSAYERLDQARRTEESNGGSTE